MTNRLIVVEPDFISVTIPKEYLDTYYRILAIFAEHGVRNINSYNTTIDSIKQRFPRIIIFIDDLTIFFLRLI